MISRKGYEIPKKNFKGDLKELTLNIEQITGVVETIPNYRETKENYILPIAYSKIKDFEITRVKLLSLKKAFLEDSNIKLREEQEKILEESLNFLDVGNKDFEGIFLNLTTGFGKTIISLKIIETLQLKTLIFVNKLELLNQWKDKILQYFPNVKVGVIQGKTIDYLDKEIVICSLQTIYKLEEDFSKKFSLTIIDEVHNFNTLKYSDIFFKCRTRFIVGLSATIENKKGTEKILYQHIGYKIISNISNFKQKSKVIVKEYRTSTVKHRYNVINKKVVVNFSRLLNDISEDYDRNILLVDTISEILKDKNRYLLVVSDRVKQLKSLNSLVDRQEISGVFLSSMGKEEREECKKKKLIFATYSIIKEGVDIPSLNSILFATPKVEITQVLGRIYRKYHENTVPLIVDIKDTWSFTLLSQYKKRMSFYYKIIKDVCVSSEEIPQENFNECLL